MGLFWGLLASSAAFVWSLSVFLQPSGGERAGE
jgi:hypothetical protein